MVLMLSSTSPSVNRQARAWMQHFRLLFPEDVWPLALWPPRHWLAG
jgi:hypothetical protein